DSPAPHAATNANATTTKPARNRVPARAHRCLPIPPGYRTPNVWRRALLITAVIAATCATTACGGSSPATDARDASRSLSRTSKRPSATSTTAAPVTTTVTNAPTTTLPPPFVGTVSRVTAADLSYSYRPGCPVAPDDLRMLHLSYWGFDAQSHLGAL